MTLPQIRFVSVCCLLVRTSSRKKLLCRRPSHLHFLNLLRKAPKSAALPMPSSFIASTTTQTSSLATLVSTTMRFVRLFFYARSLFTHFILTIVTAKIIGKMWRDESEPVKKQWKDKAEGVKRQHLRDHPDYQYQPRKPYEKKRRMTKRKAMALAAQQNTPSVSASTSASTSASASFNADMPTGITTFSPTPSTTGPFSSVTSPAQIVDLANLDDPSFHYSANGDLASFTLDSFQSNQLDLFTDLMDDHNNEMMFGPTTVRNPAACTVLPTTLNHVMADGNAGASVFNPTFTTNDLAMAQSDLTSFESSIEDMLARELQNMEQDGGLAVAVENGFQYNDLESQRFTEFLEQMPEHMWGMEFVN
jgi:hypothetical protein